MLAARIANWAFAALLMVIGLYLAVRGAELISLGGSWYYTLIGLALVAVAVLLALGKKLAATVWTAAAGITLLWSIFEAGIDFFPLLSRLAAFVVVGLWFITPWHRAAVGEPSMMKSTGLWAGAASAASFLLLIIAAVASVSYPVQQGTQIDTANLPETTDWPNPGNSPGGSRFSPLKQINLSNVSGLKEAWRIRTKVPYELKASPLQVGDMLYVCGLGSQTIALDATTGQERWRFDPKTKIPGSERGMERAANQARTCRSMGYYQGAADKAGMCAKRIILGTVDGRMLAVDAQTGGLCSEFGAGGTVNLLEGMGKHQPGNYMVTSGVLIAGKVAVVGGWVSDNQQLGNASGVIRAYDTETGAFVWAWDMGNPGYHGQPKDGGVYTPGTPNVWSLMSYDPQLNMIYLPTGNASPDYFGGKRRPFDEKYSAATVALDAATGDEKWIYQNTHHDIWDYDSPAQPVLVNIKRDGVTIPAVAQPTKRGEIFLMDRRTGAPLYPATSCENGGKPTPEGECPAPQGAVEGDFTPATQPFSGLPSFRPHLGEKDMWGVTPLDTLSCRIEFKKMRYDGHLTPPMPGGGGQPGKPTYGGSLQFPGNAGGFNWPSVSVDADNGLLVAQPMLMANRITMASENDMASGANPRRAAAAAAAAAARPAADTHGAPGAAEAPPPFKWDPALKRFGNTQNFMSTWEIPFTKVDTGMPCVEPPYGEIAVIDLNTNKLLWRKPSGSMRQMGPFGLKSGIDFPVGTPVYGGTIVTRGGLIFQTGAMDATLRAIDLRTGKEKWKAYTPYTSNSTPVTYMGKDGRQYVVITISNPGFIFPRINALPVGDEGGWVIAYALDKPNP